MGQQGHGEGKWSVLCKTRMDGSWHGKRRESGTNLAFLWSRKGIRHHSGIFVSQPDLSSWGNAASRTCPQSTAQLCQNECLWFALIFPVHWYSKPSRMTELRWLLMHLFHESLRQSGEQSIPPSMQLTRQITNHVPQTWTPKSTQSTWSRQKWSFDISASQTDWFKISKAARQKAWEQQLRAQPMKDIRGWAWVVCLASGRRNKEKLNFSAKRKVRNWLHKSFNSADRGINSGRYHFLPTWCYLGKVKFPTEEAAWGIPQEHSEIPCPRLSPGCFWHPQHTGREFLFSVIISLSSHVSVKFQIRPL